MSQPSFAHVSPEGFASFNTQLNEGDWALIDTSAWETANQSPAKALGDAPLLVFLKVRMKWSVSALIAALQGAASAKDLDINWDNAQKQLNALLAAAAVSTDPSKREAAARLQKMLLSGAGEGQTKLKYQQEVDFGHKQALLVSQNPGAADIALLGLGNAMNDIAQATSALAAAIGHGEGPERPSERQKLAASACSATFGFTAQTLAWLAANGLAGEEQNRAQRLRSSLVELAARYPAPTGNAAPNPAPVPPTPGGGGDAGGG